MEEDYKLFAIEIGGEFFFRYGNPGEDIQAIPNNELLFKKYDRTGLLPQKIWLRSSSISGTPRTIFCNTSNAVYYYEHEFKEKYPHLYVIL